jgi:hypothetical protein
MTLDQPQVLEFIRGERQEIDFASMGIRVSMSDQAIWIEEPPGVPMVRPSLSDVGMGLLVNYARSTSLRDWARLLLTANFIDLAVLEGSETGQTLLEALWQASEGVELPESAVSAARAVAS